MRCAARRSLRNNAPRAHAAEALGRLAPHTLAPFAPAVAALLADVAPQVRRAAADALAELPPAQLAAHAPALAARLGDANWQVR